MPVRRLLDKGWKFNEYAVTSTTLMKGQNCTFGTRFEIAVGLSIDGTKGKYVFISKLLASVHGRSESAVH